MKLSLTCVFILTALSLNAQRLEISIAGKATDVWETPIPDANILIKGTDRGTQANDLGQFFLKALEGEVLVISSVGYGTLELTVNKQMEQFQVVLSPQTTKLREVVVQKGNGKGKRTYYRIILKTKT